MAHMKSDQKIVHIDGGIYGTLAAVYGPQYKPYTMKLFPTIVGCARYLKRVLNTSGKETIILKPIKGNTHGLHFAATSKIFIDPRKSLREVIETLAHELIHAEQYNTGKLGVDYIRGCYKWNDQAYNSPRNYFEYRNLPWEREAFERQGELARQALASI